LFERDGDVLRPVALPRTDVYDDDLVTIQRYQGKTNERFTKLLLNITMANARVEANRRPVVLDPMAGRGTTLNQAALYGWDAIGVEIDRGDVEAHGGFFVKWLKDKRLPHKAREDAVRVNGAKVSRLTVTFAPTRQAFDGGEAQRLAFVLGDARHVDQFTAKNSIDAIVVDLPYGVRHGAHQTASERERTPAWLVEKCLPAWSEVLRANGAIGLAFNTHVLKRAELVGLLEAAGFEALADGPYGQLEHRVDQSIQRDVVIARRRPRPRTSA
jgi:tRNA G10  N-methylase Trm11